MGRQAAGRVDGRPPSGRARGRSGGRHCTAGQYGYVLLGRHFVINVANELKRLLKITGRHIRRIISEPCKIETRVLRTIERRYIQACQIMPLSMSLSDLQVHSLTPAFYNCNRLEIVASIPIGYSAAVADECKFIRQLEFQLPSPN